MEWRLIGGIAVSLLTWVHGVTHLVPERDTADADLAAPHALLADPEFMPALVELGYEQVAGNRFERKIVHGDDPLKSPSGNTSSSTRCLVSRSRWPCRP
jgi:hypothetical protein